MWIEQHAEDAAMLRNQRAQLLRSAQGSLHALERVDARIAAHLDGLLEAGPCGTGASRAALDQPSAGVVFAAACTAIAAGVWAFHDKLLLLAQALPEARRGMVSALGWLEPELLRGAVHRMLVSVQPAARAIGLAACRLHRAHPGAVLRAWIADADPAVQLEALRCAGALGRLDMLGACQAALGTPNPAVALQAAIACLLLGDRGAAVDHLATLCHPHHQVLTAPGESALLWLMQALPFAEAGALARDLARSAANDPALLRPLIRACALLGDAAVVPWLIAQMAEPALARLAGEALTWITGADLAALGLAGQPPGTFECYPDDAGEPLDEDEGLAWPDAARLRDWWQAGGTRPPQGTRWLMGQPITQCTELKPGHPLYA
jgi:uncharacterized protein (TIGR02270 family)